VAHVNILLKTGPQKRPVVYEYSGNVVYVAVEQSLLTFTGLLFNHRVQACELFLAGGRAADMVDE
jgi:hypothetical protein